MQRTTNFDSSELRSLFPSACHQFDQSAKQTIHTFLWNQSSRFFNGKPNVLFQKVLVNRNFNGLPPNFCKAVNHLYSSDPEDLQRLFYTHILNCLYFSLSKRKIPRSKSSIYHKPRQRIKSREASKFDPLSPSVESLLETIHWLLFADNCAFNKNFTFTDVKDFIKCLLPIAFRVNVVRDFKDSHMLQKGQLSLWMRLQHFQIPDIPAFQNLGWVRRRRRRRCFLLRRKSGGFELKFRRRLRRRRRRRICGEPAGVLSANSAAAGGAAAPPPQAAGVAAGVSENFFKLRGCGPAAAAAG